VPEGGFYRASKFVDAFQTRKGSMQVTGADLNDRPTGIRHVLVIGTTLMALLLYLDRFAVGIASEYIREDLRMTQSQMSLFLSAFFFSYALGQVPAGWAADRFGACRMLAIYILGWSLFTGLMGVATAVSGILLCRLLCGIFQAGAYPTAGGLIRVWYPIYRRGVASSIVALGGRAGGVLAPLLTAWLMIQFTSGTDLRFEPDQILDEPKFLAVWTRQDLGTQGLARDRLFERLPEDVRTRLTSGAQPPQELLAPLADSVSVAFKEPQLFQGIETAGWKLDAQARKLSGMTSRTARETELWNRFVFESVFAGTVERIRGQGWRPTMIVYGLIGIGVAVGFLMVCRDTPAQHPWCNVAEQQLIDDEPSRAAAATHAGVVQLPVKALLTNVSLWGNSLMQVFTNIGWVFVVTWLPRYLDKIHGIPLAGQAVMTAIPTAAGIIGMYLGGRWTDGITAAAGRKWGRRIPILVTRFTAALGYAICLGLSLSFAPGTTGAWLPWGYVAALSLMAFSVDMGNPAVWGYAQDVGGRATGVILGWANMWGNLGAAVAPPLYNLVLGETPAVGNWNLLFGLCLLAFLASGVCALVMDSERPLQSA